MALIIIALLMLPLLVSASSTIALTVGDKDNEVDGELTIVCDGGCTLTCGGSPIGVSPGDTVKVDIDSENEGLYVSKAGSAITINGYVEEVEKNGATVCSGDTVQLSMAFSSLSGNLELESESDDDNGRPVHLVVDGNVVINDPDSLDEVQVNVDLTCTFTVTLGASNLQFNGCGDAIVNGSYVPEAPLVAVPAIAALIALFAVAYRNRLAARR